MPSDRILKVNELIKQELGNIILKEMEFPKDMLVTVTRVETSSNLIQAKVYISTIPISQLPKVLQILNKKVFDIQQVLNKRLKMRPIPKIKFTEEKETKRAEKVERLLEDIKN